MCERRVLLLVLRRLVIFRLNLVRVGKVVRPEGSVLADVFVQQMRRSVAVDPLVLRQNRALSKRLPAALKRTWKRLAVVVDPRVLDEMRFLAKAFPTVAVKRAHEGSRVEVDPFVLDQRGLQAKSFLAQRAAKAFAFLDFRSVVRLVVILLRDDRLG